MTILVMKELAIRRFQESLDLLEKPSGDRSVDNTVGRGETHGHHRPHSNTFAVRDNARPNLANCKDRALRRIDDSDEAVHTKHPKIRDRESTAFIIQREKFFLLRLLRQLAAFFGQLLQ